MKKSLNIFSAIRVTQWLYQKNEGKSTINLGLICRENIKGARECFKSLMGKYLEPKCITK